MLKKPYKGLRIAISICLVLALLCAAAVGILGYLEVFFTTELWLAITCCVIAALTLILWIWFLCVSAKLVKNGESKQETEKDPETETK